MTESTHYSETPEAFKVYCEYIAIKNHFKEDHFNYFAYSGGSSVTTKSYQKRKDKEYFFALSQKKNPEKRILAHVLNDPDVWVRDILDNEKPYSKWLKTHESFTYVFKNDLSRYDNLKNAIKIRDGEMFPLIIEDHIAGDVCLETIAALDIATNVMDFWKSRISEDRLFQPLYKKVRKYRPFLSLNKSKLLNIINPS